MKKSILIIAMITLSNLGFGQVVNQTKKETDTVSVSNVKKISSQVVNQTKQRQTYDSSRMDEVSEAFYILISKMTEEEKKRFISEFVVERGHFKIPD